MARYIGNTRDEQEISNEVLVGELLYVESGGVANNVTMIGGTCYLYSGGKVDGLILEQGAMVVVRSGSEVDNLKVGNGCTLNMTNASGMSVSGVELDDGAKLWMEVDGRTALSGTCSNGDFSIGKADEDGKIAVNGLSLHYGSSLTIGAGCVMEDVSVDWGGELNVGSGAVVTGLLLEAGSRLNPTLDDQTHIEGTYVDGGAFSIIGNRISGLVIARYGSLEIRNGHIADNIRVLSGGMLTLKQGGIVTDLAMDANSRLYLEVSKQGKVTGTYAGRAFALEDGKAEGFVLSEYSKMDVLGGTEVRDIEFAVDTTCTVMGNAVMADIVMGGTMSIGNYTIDAQGGGFQFAMGGRYPGTSAMLNRLDGLLNAELSVSVGSNQRYGSYSLAGGASSVRDDEIEFFIDNESKGFFLAPGLGESSNSFVRGITEFKLSLSTSKVLNLETFEATDLYIYTVNGIEQKLWRGFAGDAETGYTLSVAWDGNLDAAKNLGTTLDGGEIYVNKTQGFGVAQLSNDGDHSDAMAMSKVTADAGPKLYAGLADGRREDFFAWSGEQWGDGYAAQHASSEVASLPISLKGMNRFRDAFQGSTDASVLWLTDDLHGDALCLDDMFSEFGDAGRVLAFDEVNAGAGDDLLDFSSNRFQENSTALTLRGGAGNDIIWAGTGRPFILYGDEGDDILVGGGNVGDQFVFQGDWGNDTVQQLAGAPVELVFRGVDIQVEGIIADGNTLFDFGENRKVTVLGRTEGINVNYEL